MFKELWEIYGVMGLGEGFFEGIWGGEVWYDWVGLGMWNLRNGLGVGFWGDVAIGKYSGLVSRCTKSF